LNSGEHEFLTTITHTAINLFQSMNKTYTQSDLNRWQTQADQRAEELKAAYWEQHAAVQSTGFKREDDQVQAILGLTKLANAFDLAAS